MRRAPALAGQPSLSVRAPERPRRPPAPEPGRPPRARPQPPGRPVRPTRPARPSRPTGPQRPARPAPRGRAAPPPAPLPPVRRGRRPKRPSVFWRYRRLWFLIGFLGLTALAGVGWVITHIPLPPQVPQAQTSIVYDGTGAQIALLHGNENRFPVRLDQVPRVTQDAVIAAEDRNFFRHRGVDPIGVLRATWADLRHKGVRQGASTITQQYVKNAFLAGGHQRTIFRKLKEAVVAVKLEHKYSKPAILERYLNTVYFGRGAYGIEAAAKAYFNVDVGQLDLQQSAYLAGLIRSPSAGDVANDPARAKQLRALVLTSMVRDRKVTRAQADQAETRSLTTSVVTPTKSDTTVTSSTKGIEYFVEYVRKQLADRYGEDEVLRGGLRVYTTLDPRLQNLAYDAVYGETLNKPSDPAGALVSVDGDGRVVAMVGGRDWATSKVNLAVGADGGGGGRQGGSAFKPFVLAETVHEGYSVESSFPGPAKIVLPKIDSGTDWEVNNYDGAAYGRINLIDATVNSVNTVYAQLVAAIGPDKVASMANHMGIRSRLNPVPSITLGTQNVSVLEMAGAYLTLAREGVQVDPRVFKRVTVSGSTLVDDRAKATRVLERNEADTVNFVLRQVVERGSGAKAKLPGGPAWGKTGTTEDYGDAWFVGFNHKLTTAVWMGYPSGQSRPMVDVHGYAKVNGGSLPAEIWRKFMARAAPDDTAEYPVPTSFGGKALGALIPFNVPTSNGASAGPATTPTSAPAATVAPKAGPKAPASGSAPAPPAAAVLPPPTAPPTTQPTQSTQPPVSISIPTMPVPRPPRPSRP